MTRRDLDLVSTPDLIEALLARFDCAVIVGQRPSEVPAEGIELRWCGSLVEARGWISYAGDLLTDEMRLQMPEKEEKIGQYFEEYVVKPGLVSDKYLEVFNELDKMKKLVKEGKILDLQKQDILMHREYVRKFIKEAGRLLRGKTKPQL